MSPVNDALCVDVRSRCNHFHSDFHIPPLLSLELAFDSSSITGPQNPFFTVQGGDDLPTDRRDAGFKRQSCDDLLE